MAQCAEFSSIQPPNETENIHNNDNPKQDHPPWHRHGNYQIHPQQHQQQPMSMMLQQQQQQHQASMMQTQQHPTVVYQVAPHSSVGQSYKYRQASMLSLAHIAVGTCCIIFQLAAFGVRASFSQIMPGVWAGIMFLLTGVIGYRSAMTRTQCSVSTFMVLCILNAVLCAPVVFISGAGIASDSLLPSHSVSVNDCRGNCTMPFRYHGGKRDTKLALNSLLILLALTECVLACWAAAICCAGICCRAPPIAGEVVFYNPTAVQGFSSTQQVVLVNPGQARVVYRGSVSMGHSSISPGATGPQAHPFHISSGTQDNPSRYMSSQSRMFQRGSDFRSPSAPPPYNHSHNVSEVNSFSYQPLGAQGGESQVQNELTMAQKI